MGIRKMQDLDGGEPFWRLCRPPYNYANGGQSGVGPAGAHSQENCSDLEWRIRSRSRRIKLHCCSGRIKKRRRDELYIIESDHRHQHWFFVDRYTCLYGPCNNIIQGTYTLSVKIPQEHFLDKYPLLFLSNETFLATTDNMTFLSCRL